MFTKLDTYSVPKFYLHNHIFLTMTPLNKYLHGFKLSYIANIKASNIQFNKWSSSWRSVI